MFLRSSSSCLSTLDNKVLSPNLSLSMVWKDHLANSITTTKMNSQQCQEKPWSLNSRRKVWFIHSFPLCLSVRPSVRPSLRPSLRQPARSYVAPSVRLFVSPSVRSSVCFSLRPFVCLFLPPSLRPFVCLFLPPSLHPFVCLFLPPSVRLFVSPSVRSSVCFSLRLFVSPSVRSNLFFLLSPAISLPLSVSFSLLHWTDIYTEDGTVPYVLLY